VGSLEGQQKATGRYMIPGTQEVADFLITIVITVVGSAWAGVWFVKNRREQSFLMKLRSQDQSLEHTERLARLKMEEEEHDAKIELLKELRSQQRLELTSDGQIRQTK